MTVTDAESRGNKERSAANCSGRRLTESSACENTEDPNSYLEPSLCHINESEFFSSATLGDASVVDDSIVDTVDCGRKPRPASNNADRDTNRQTDRA